MAKTKPTQRLLPTISGQKCDGLAFVEKLRHGVTMTFESVTPFTPENRAFEQVVFDRKELGIITGVYGRFVAAGEWRDYGISSLREVAVFSVFQRTAEHPLYRIEKRPKLRHKQGMYAVIGMDGQVLKRGQDLRVVLRVLERKLIRSID